MEIFQLFFSFLFVPANCKYLSFLDDNSKKNELRSILLTINWLRFVSLQNKSLMVYHLKTINSIMFSALNALHFLE